MNTVLLNYLIEFLAFFLIVGIIIYALPAGLFYFFFYQKKVNLPKIQTKTGSSKDIRREIRLSINSVFVFAIGGTLVYQLIKQGHSLFYYDWSDYPSYYHFISFYLCLIVHDAYFYWTHRFMHWRPIFKYFHKGHHESLAPTPWASLAFQPLEALVQLGTFVLIIFVVPLHPIVFCIYIAYDTAVNTAGHNGFELVPRWFSKAPILKLGNTVTHHEQHHIDFKSNYGAFFNVWDRICGTFKDSD